ncbi:MAG: exodeoxyribonuclease V subunit gamma [Jatrophihabitans sp.]|uniref:exodeoxyribonuclease V subunit gamma n=1 Tax=Jatrophihabitans sp. TaxID=1932789 RepID=UPI003F8207DC
MLIIHRAERADALATALGEVLAAPADDVFRPEIVAVPSKGVERWLAQRLSHRLGAGAHGDGVCANVLFPSSSRLLDERAAEADETYRESVERWHPERAVWPLLEVVDRCAPTEAWCRVLAVHLGLDGSGVEKGRRFAVASKLAQLFDRYGRSRPEMINAWQQGRDEQGDGEPLPDDLRWQAELWRRLRAEIGHPAPAEVLDAACARLAPGPGFSIFGPTRISAARVRILHALAADRDVHLWLHHPSPMLWQQVAERGERPGRRRAQPVAARHPLLASMSRDVRELQQSLMAAPHDDRHHPIPARPATLLGRLQDDLAHDRAPSTDLMADGSVQVHAAHGPARQVEILREVLLGLLAADPTLEPRDILVMCPDVETFAPLVAATFGMADEPGGHPAARLRVKLADRALRQTNPLLTLLARLLDLAIGRVTATQVLDLAGSASVRRRFGFDDDDVERLREWAVASGARWGLDAEHRGAYHLGHLAQGTWRTALDRILLGVTMEDDAAWVGTTVPLDDVDSGDIDLAGRLAELVARVDEAVRTFAGTHTIPEWMRLLAAATLSLGEAEQPWQTMQLRRELDEVATAAEGSDLTLGLADVASLLRGRLAGRPSRASFRTGTLTVCTLVPMRSVPHRVVCLVGMDDGVFPRRAVPDGDDVLAREPRTGERDARSEDRQLFLDAVCAAQETLVITYTGADPRTGVEVPPSVPLGELLDVLGGARDGVVVRHPLQPFDARNFTPGALRPREVFSFDPSGLAGARAAARPRHEPAPLVADPLPSPAPSPVIDLDDLVRFVQHPARGFLRQRLDIALPREEEEPSDDLPIEVKGLSEWAVGDRVLRACVGGMPTRTAARLERMRGDLPPGPLGDATLQTVGRSIDALLHASAAERAIEPRSLDVAVTLVDGRSLVGTVPGVRGDVVLSVTYSSLRPRQRLAAWVAYLAVVAATGDGRWRSVTIGRDRGDAARCQFGGVSPADAQLVLSELARLRDVGLCSPLPVALATSEAYARRRSRGMPVDPAVASAEQQWIKGFAPEREEFEHVLLYGREAPLRRLLAEPAGDDAIGGETTRFGALARRIWEPLFRAES